MILLIFFAIIAGAVYKKINVFDAFIDGAKEGFNVCVKIIPYLVGMLIAISLLRTSGVFDGEGEAVPFAQRVIAVARIVEKEVFVEANVDVSAA